MLRRILLVALAVVVLIGAGVAALVIASRVLPAREKGVQVLQFRAHVQNLDVGRGSAQAPDGKVTADLIEDPVGSAHGTIFEDVKVGADDAMRSFSVFFKKGSSRRAQFMLSYLEGERSKTYFAVVDLNSITVPASDGDLSITNEGSGWFKLDLAGANPRMTSARIQVVPSIGEPAQPGSLYIWNPRLTDR
jgi:hypothetical protein